MPTLSNVPEGIYKDIAKEKNPDQFIDLLCVNHYFAGQFGNNVPVSEARVTFEAWLDRHVNQQIKSVFDELEGEAEAFERTSKERDGLTHFAVPLSTIQKIRSRYESSHSM